MRRPGLNYKLLLCLLCLNFFFSGCLGLIKKSFVKPTLSYEAVKIEKWEPSGALIRLYLGIDNPNNLDFDLDSMKHVVYVGGKKIFETVIKDKVYIKPKDKTVVEFPISISFTGLQDSILEVWQQKALKYMVDSKVIFNTALGKLPVKIKFEDILKLPPLPELSIDHIKIDNMSFTEVNLILYVKISNNEKIKLDVEQMAYEIFLNDLEVAKGEMEPQLNFKEDSGSTEKAANQKDPPNKDQKQVLLPIPVKMKLLSVKKGVTELFKSGKINYEIHIKLKGKSVYGDYLLPLDKKGVTRIY